MGVGGQRHAPAALAPGSDLGPIVQGPGRAPGLVGTGVGNLAATGFWSSDHPAHGELLCNEAILMTISIKNKKRIKWNLNQNVGEIFPLTNIYLHYLAPCLSLNISTNFVHFWLVSSYIILLCFL